MKNQKYDVRRPLVHGVLFYTIGIICADQLIKGQNIFLLMPIMSLLIIGYIFCFGYLPGFYGLMILIMGAVLFIYCPLQQERDAFIPKKSYILKGQVEEVSRTPYYEWVTLKGVEEETSHQKIRSKVQIRFKLKETISTYDDLMVQGECLEMTPKMNPSDFDYATYLKGKGIVATFKAKQIMNLKKHTPLIEQIREACTAQLEKLFSADQVGIMEAALLGDDSQLDETTDAIYQKAGIGHVLCISGFHVGVVTGLMMFLFSYVPLPYTVRQLAMILAIIFYARLSGGAPSTIRATIMVCVGLLGKCFWQEEDRLTTWAVAAWCLLINNPYQLFMVGVQLSFMAVLGVTICMEEMAKKERFVEWKYTELRRTLIVWLGVQLFTWPILAYHFYEVPFLISFLNLFIIPIFSIIIISGWWILGLSFLPGFFSLARVGSWCIERILSTIERLASVFLRCPLATLCTGKPSAFEIILYGMMVFLIGYVIWGEQSKKRAYQGFACLACLWILNGMIGSKQNLKMNCLYIGQGDCCVVEMPKYGLFIIDGGPFGKGKEIENYAKYLGYTKIQGIMVSHSDADHIGGVLELLDTSLELGHVFVSRTDHSDQLNELVKRCSEKGIPISYLGSGDILKYGQVKFQCLAPLQATNYKNNNDNSIVCKLNYGRFSALFTGDKSKGIDEKAYEQIESISVLKVSHHGSRTGTSKGLLLKLQPRYAMISCGRENRYGHPHQEVVDLLSDEKVVISRTDVEGAIVYETDGSYLKETSYRKDA